ncbi:MAG TPA: lysophospholipid acyltransferase family protein [Melioribacteraceae bacterium]|nr:lysophospholipid acyltransferase family protein [Melioribacteraceae bacterium]
MHSYKRFLPAEDQYKTGIKNTRRIFPSLYFYLVHVLRIILYSNKQARNNKYDEINWVNSSLDILESIEKAGVRITVTGINNIKKVEGPVVFVSNHMSILETFLFPSFIHQIKKIVYVIKSELATFPLFGPIAMARHPIVVGRENPKEDLMTVLNVGSDRIKEGFSVIIFPQRTRSKIFDPEGFNSLGIKLAKRNNIPVIPVAIVTDAWQNGKIIKEFGRIDPDKEVHIAFGEPMTVTGNGTEQHDKSVQFILNSLKSWNRADLIK